MSTKFASVSRAARTSLAAAALVLAAWLGASAQTRELRLVSTPWPPFTNESGQPRFALDLVEAAATRIGLRAITSIVEASAFTSALLSGPYDGSAAAWKDAERESVLVFSQPYLENRLMLVGRRGADVSAKTFADLKGKRIAIVAGYSYGDAVEGPGPTLVRSRSEEHSLQLLLTSGVDYTLMDELVVQYIVDHYAEEARTRLQVGTTPMIVRPLYFCVRRSVPDAQSIVDRFNSQLRAMIVDRTYHRLLHVAWISADVDGDGVPEYVPASDKSGPTAPQRAYSLFSDPQVKPDQVRKEEQRFYVGGNIYSSWAAVPDSYKTIQEPPDSRRSTASIFSFSWR